MDTLNGYARSLVRAFGSGDEKEIAKLWIKELKSDRHECRYLGNLLNYIYCNGPKVVFDIYTLNKLFMTFSEINPEGIYPSFKRLIHLKYLNDRFLSIDGNHKDFHVIFSLINSFAVCDASYTIGLNGLVWLFIPGYNLDRWEIDFSQLTDELVCSATMAIMKWKYRKLELAKYDIENLML